MDAVTDIDIHQSIIVHIDDGNAPCPTPQPFNAGFFRYILEFEISPVEVQPARYHIAPEIDIGESVIVEVADANPSPVIDVHNIQRVDRVALDDSIGKDDTRMRGRYLLEQMMILMTSG